MSDEQTIYISPEDDLTTVRERLESIPNRNVTLVIPAQTQLRSHVAWKLLYARARELNKEVLIVSSDPQVRSVAHAVKFKVVHSLEASQSGKSRPVSRATRANTVKSKSTSARTSKNIKNSNNLRARPQDAVEQQQALPQDIDEVPFLDEEPGNLDTPATGKQYGQSYGYHIDTTPSIHPLTPEQIEEPDLFFEDYAVAQNIRKAAQSRPAQNFSGSREDEDDDTPPFEQAPGAVNKPVARAPRKSKALPPRTSRPLVKKDPFIEVEDSDSLAPKEQRAGASLTGFQTKEHVIQDVADYPTKMIQPQIDYNDQDDFLPAIDKPVAGKRGFDQAYEQRPAELKPPRAKTSKPADLQRSQDTQARRPEPSKPVRIQNEGPATLENKTTKRPSRSLQGTGARDYSPRPGMKGPDPVQLPNAARMSQKGANTRNRISVPLRPSGPLRPQPGPMRPSGQLKPRPMAVSRKPASRRSNAPVFIGVGIAIILVLLLGGAALLLPAADVKLTIESQAYSKALSLSAMPGAKNNAIPAQQLTREFRQKGNASATGTKLLGRGKAKGNVCFNNTDDNQVEIPTGTIVATQSGVQFTTQADVVIPGNHSCATFLIPDPVEAVNAGDSGNVNAGTVVAIPDSSLDAIAKVNKTTANNLKLTVSNSDGITGGGVQPFPAVTDKDLENARIALRKQAQSDIDAWSKTLPRDGIVGKIYTTDTLVNAPAKDSVIENGKTFPAELKISAVALFVKDQDLQQASIEQLNTQLSKDKTLKNYTVVADSKPAVLIQEVKQESKDGNELKLSFKATGQIVLNTPREDIQALIQGKNPEAAKNELKQNIRGVKKIDIAVNPGFFPSLPLLANRINVMFIPEAKASAGANK